MSKTISILGVDVEISTPYAAGHVLTEAEAKSLNQTRCENIGNNFRKAIKAAQEGAEGAKPLDQVLAELAEYDATYAFTMGSTGTSRSSMTPLEREANRVAKQWLVGKLKAQNSSMKAYTDEKGEEFVKGKIAEIAATDAIQAVAKKNLANAQKGAESLEVAL